MADTPISGLPAGSTPVGADLAVGVQSGVTKKLTFTQIMSAVIALLGDPDIFLTANSDVKFATQRAVKAYVLANSGLFAAQAANVVFSGPTSGTAAPAFRALVVGDLPFAGSAGGVATLDGTSKVPTGQLPASVTGGMTYQGTWNASSNSPTLTSSTGTKGFFYKVSTAGTTSLDGIATWNIGDSVVYDGTTWDKIDGIANEVVSVAGLQGVITGSALVTALGLTGGVPVNSQSTDYTLVIGDANSCIAHPAADTTARTFTIPANSSVPLPVGTVVTFDNDFGGGTITIAITSDIMVLVGSAGSTGSRTLASGGQATALKVTSTRWRINGSGLT